MNRKYTWLKPKEKKIYTIDHNLDKVVLPSKIDFRIKYKLPKCYDQGNLGSCTANALGFAHQFTQIKNRNYYKFQPSRLFLYYKERAIENTINIDSGAYISTGVNVMQKTGICEESFWPYNVSKFRTKPTKTADYQALKFKVSSVSPINDNILQIKTNLNSGYPIVFGFIVYQSFESSTVTRTGMMNMPDFSTEEILGGHAIIAIGYDDNINCVICRNSWGSNWGDKGYFYMPYDYITNGDLCDEFYVVKKISNPKYAKPKNVSNANANVKSNVNKISVSIKLNKPIEVKKKKNILLKPNKKPIKLIRIK